MGSTPGDPPLFLRAHRFEPVRDVGVSVPEKRVVSLPTATGLVIANMVGTGVFTSLGFQIPGLPSAWVILTLWLVGGLCSLFGALAYGELAAALPRSGGEYHYLNAAYHPAVGFMSGWVSLLVGFSAPVALAAMAFGRYFHTLLPGVSPELAAQTVVLGVTVIHLAGGRAGSLFQNAATGAKILLILVLIGAGWLLTPGSQTPFAFNPGETRLLASPDFAVSLIYVMYAYTGWNASTYIAGEIRDPQRNLPLSVLLGTVFVTLLYIGLNTTFLRAAPLSELSGKLEVGQVAAAHSFGPTGGRIMSGLICAGLLSSLSAMTWVGPRVTVAVARDFPLLAPLGRKNGRDVPVAAMGLQTAMVLLLLATRSFETVLTYLQCALSLCSLLTVAAVFVLRVRQPDLPRPSKTWGYPFTPAVFVGVNIWMLWHVLKAHPRESLIGLATLIAGLAFFALRKPNQPRDSGSPG